MAEVSLVKLPSEKSQWTLLISVNIGSGNDLLPSGNKPLFEPLLCLICYLIVSLGHNELKWSDNQGPRLLTGQLIQH